MRVRLDLPHADGTTTPVLLERSEDLEDGRRKWISRSRVPIDGALLVRDISHIAPPVVERAGHADEEEEEKRNVHDGMVLEGIASSTSVDWHGTAMSREALESMATQFRNGVPYVPAHHRDEWDDVMGTTYEAEIVESQSGMPTMLQVRTRLYRDDPRTAQLVERLRDGMKIGQSIGGWFTELDVVTNDQDEVESITIRGVELDHLAVTRRPSNPDSYIARLLMDGTRALRAATTLETVESTIQAGNHRHVWKVVETEEAVHVVFGKAHDHWDGVHPMSPDDDDSNEDMEERDDVEEVTETRETVEVETRETTSYSDLPMAPMDMEWDWNTAAQDEVLYEGRDEDDPDWSRYERAHVWMDPEADAETKAAYKLPIAKMVEGRLHVVFRGVVAAMAALNGARGGVDIPDADRQGVYDHLVRYYEKADRDPPELRHGVHQHGSVRISNYMDLALEEGDRAWTWTREEQDAVLGDQDWQQYQLAHLSYNYDTPEDRESYRYPFARMVDGELRVSMRAVRSIMDRVIDDGSEFPGNQRALAYEHLARYYTKAGEVPPTMQVTQSSPGDTVDTRDMPCSDAIVGSDAHGSAFLADQSNPHASEVRTMSEQDNNVEASTETDRLSRLEALLERTVTTVAALAASNTPAPEPVETEVAPVSDDSEVEALRARLQAMEQTITRMAQAPVRTGRPHTSSVVRNLPATGYGMIVRDASGHLPEGSALVAVCRDQEVRRSAGLDDLPSRRSLEQDLRSILHAALVDGVITDPDTRANWS